MKLIPMIAVILLVGCGSDSPTTNPVDATEQTDTQTSEEDKLVELSYELVSEAELQSSLNAIDQSDENMFDNVAVLEQQIRDELVGVSDRAEIAALFAGVAQKIEERGLGMMRNRPSRIMMGRLQNRMRDRIGPRPIKDAMTSILERRMPRILDRMRAIKDRMANR